METAMISNHASAMQPQLVLTDTDSVGTIAFGGMLRTTRHYPPSSIIRTIVHSKAPQQHIAWVTPDITLESVDSEQIFEAIQSLYLSDNRPRDRQIADRILALYRDALAEEERILSASLRQFASFFLANPDLGFPRITLTPDGTLRARWIQGKDSFTAIEFTGTPLAKLVAEIPRDRGLTAQYFSSEPVDSILSFARAIGASFV